MIFGCDALPQNNDKNKSETVNKVPELLIMSGSFVRKCETQKVDERKGCFLGMSRWHAERRKGNRVFSRISYTFKGK
jgi:hypothetical protein